MKPSIKFDEWLFGQLLCGSYELGSYRRDALETYRDLRRDAKRRRGFRGVVGNFFHAVLHVIGVIARERFSAYSRRALRPRWTSPHGRRPELGKLLLQDLRRTLRGFRQKPGFALAVVTTLALSIGLTTIVFSIVDGVLLRQLPYPEAERLVYFDEGSFPGPLYQEWREDLVSVESLAAAWWDQIRGLTGDGPPVQLSAAGVTANFLPLFGAVAEQGRLILETDAYQDRVVVISDGLWARRWGRDPSVVGRSVVLDGESWTVIGVVSSAFVPPEAVVGPQVDLWLPLETEHEWMEGWDMHILAIVGRLRPGVDRAAAQAELDAYSRAVAERQSERRSKGGEPELTPLVPLHEITVGAVRRHLTLLLGAVGLMLLIGCANVANLLLARGNDRRRELALHAVLGAGRARLACQLFVESLVLSVAGGIFGLVLAHLGVRVFMVLQPLSLPRMSEIVVDGRILSFAIAVSIATGLLFGLAPALQAARTDVHGVLKETPGTGAGRQRLRGSLVIAEFALALMLLVGAGLLGHSLFKQLRTEPGFAADGLVRLKLDLGSDSYEDSRVAFTRQLVEGLEATPGILSATAGWTMPFDYTAGGRCCWRTVFSTASDLETQRSIVHPITPGYFATLGVPEVRGRELTWADGDASPVPIVLNRTAAKMFFGDEEPLGQRLMMGRQEPAEMRVAGVVGDVRRWGLTAGPDPAVYLPFSAYGSDTEELSVVVRTVAGLTPQVAESLQEVVWRLNPALPIGEIATMPRMISESLGEPRFYSLLFGIFAGLAVLLAATGIASSLLYAIGQRRREMGIRLAVGARDVDLMKLVVRQGMALAVAGMALGLLGASWLSRFLDSLIHGLEPTDLPTFAAVSAVLGVVALFACLVPALEASRTDPAETLRAD